VSKYGGEFLIAVERNPSDKNLPIAFAIVGMEKRCLIMV